MAVYCKAYFKDTTGKGWSEHIYAAAGQTRPAFARGTGGNPGAAQLWLAARCQLMAAGVRCIRAYVSDDTVFRDALPVAPPPLQIGLVNGVATPLYNPATAADGPADVAWTGLLVTATAVDGLYQSRTILSGLADSYYQNPFFLPSQNWLESWRAYVTLLTDPNATRFGFPSQDKGLASRPWAVEDVTVFPGLGTRDAPAAMIITLAHEAESKIAAMLGHNVLVGRLRGTPGGLNGLRKVAFANPGSDPVPDWLPNDSIAVTSPFIPDYEYDQGGYVQIRTSVMNLFQTLDITGPTSRKRGPAFGVGRGRRRVKKVLG